MIRPRKFVPGDFLRACDLCGIRYRASQLRRGEDGFWRCMAYCQEVPAITRDRISAESQKRREAPPPPHGIPYDRQSTFAAESVIFNFLCETPFRDPNWPGGIRNGLAPQSQAVVTAGGMAPLGTYNVASSAETAIYCYGIINEAKRPTAWAKSATTKLQELADWLITRQQGFGISPGSTKSNDQAWGAVAATTIVFTTHVALAGLAFIRAHKTFGGTKYLVSARAVASFLRNVQSIGQFLSAKFPSTTSGGSTRLYTGALSGVETLTDLLPGGAEASPDGNMAVLQFWTELLLLDGDQQIGADGTVGGVFTSAPQIALTQAIADLRAFWSVGTYDVTIGAIVNGFSSTTPKDQWSPFTSTGSGFGSWIYFDTVDPTGVTVSGENYAMALRHLFAVEGYSSQVADVWQWLMTFTTNSATVSPAGTLATDFSCATSTLAANPPPPPPRSGNVIAPGYDPKLSLTTELQVRDPSTHAATKINATSLYHWTTSGMMAAIQSAQNGGALRTAKQQITAGRLRQLPQWNTDPGVSEDYIMLRGTSGLAFQLSMFDTGLSRFWSSAYAARIGNVFRYQPQAWVGTQAPTQQPGVRV